jgi:hypothetical protein
MPKISLNLSDRILKVLQKNYNKIYTLEELTKIVIPLSDFNYENQRDLDSEKAIESEILDALIILADNNLILLNELTDESLIKISTAN